MFPSFTTKSVSPKRTQSVPPPLKSKKSATRSCPTSPQRPLPKWSKPDAPKETNALRVANRMKQIEYGKNTPGYENYVKAVPIDQRTARHPWTPDPTQVCSKRAFDGQMVKWRQKLHLWDDFVPGQMPVPTCTTPPAIADSDMPSHPHSIIGPPPGLLLPSRIDVAPILLADHLVCRFCNVACFSIDDLRAHNRSPAHLIAASTTSRPSNPAPASHLELHAASG
eukprot:gnl/Spiro4/22219_TR10938_c0_g1_i1.p1 gnl/Spiro4/22219_TR10938_c0_g1~~gnl/Spiro4/22219_TR10938_c0_g1_i1.p1  ORF type:complete len:224 (-),score=20.39 gnl/Spiro4/22219_TR10938_c0_g1_i1:74-745(-)